MDIYSPLLLVLMTIELCSQGVEPARQGSRKRGGKQRMNIKAKRPEERNQPGLPRGPPSTSSTVDRLLKLYNRQDPPSKDKPTEVKLGIYINSFYSISEQTMDYSVSMYLRQSWRDERLKFTPKSIEKSASELRLGDKRWNDIWIPDVFFRNEKRAAFHDVTVANRLLKLNSTGHLWYVCKISAALSCPMKLQKYPLDTQTCPMMFESFGYTMDTMFFGWLSGPVDVDKDVQLPQFTLQDIILYDCSQNYTAGQIIPPLPSILIMPVSPKLSSCSFELTILWVDVFELGLF